jgi:hypothetical protein
MMTEQERGHSVFNRETFSGRKISTFRSIGLLALMILTLAGLAGAQSAGNFDTGTITGTVTDQSGAVIPHAAVTITNTGTGIVTTATTGDNGLFTVPALPFGNYTVSASANQFGKAASKSFVLNVGATARVDLKLSVATVSEDVQVTGTMATVNLSNATSGTTLNAEQIENLPTNGRDVMDFLNIAPGSVNSTGYFQGSINGQENFMSGIDVTLDGQNASRPDISGFDETEGNEANRMTRASVDSVQEIDFANSGYSADVGHSLGPQMNIITKGGTNQFHGEVFEFFRNDALDAEDYFYNPINTPSVPLRMNQFGGNLGGPIASNKLFFFVNYEGLQQHTTQINKLNLVPSAYVRSQFNTAMQPVLAQMAPLSANCQGIVGEPGYNGTCAYPLNPNGNPTYQDVDIFGDPLPQNGSDLVFQPSALPTTVSENSGAVRVDYSLGNSDRIFARYTIDDGLTTQAYGINEGQTSPLALVNQYGVIDETHTFTPTLINELSVAVQRFHSDTNSNTPQPFVGFSGFFTNLGSLPGPATFNQINDQATFNILDNATKTAGSWSFKFGAQIQFNRLDGWLRPQQEFEFGSFDSLEADQPFILSKIGFPGFYGVRNSNWDMYANGDWRPNNRLTINLGVRLDVNSVWSERNHLQQNFDFATQSFLPPTQQLYSPTVDAAPRLGLSYDPYGHGKTVIHAYYGLFYLPLQFGANFVANNPSYQSYSVNIFQAPISYPEANPALPAGTQNVSIMPKDVHDAYSDNWLFGIQQEVMKNTVLTVNYVGNETKRMQAGQNFAGINLNPANLVSDNNRPYSGFANENLEACELAGAYNSLQVGLRHNVGKLNYEANYTWSHTINDMVNFLNNYSDPLDPTKDMGNADWDIRHNFTASMTYNLPDLKGRNALMRTALGGWQTSSIVQTRSGAALNPTLVGTFFGLPTRPDFSGSPVRKSGGSWPNGVYGTAGYSVEPDYNGNPGDPSTLGNVPRNSLPGPAFFQWDFSGMKNFPVTEKAKVQFRADLFNVLNHPNFGNPGDMGICTGISLPTATTPASCSGATFTGGALTNPNYNPNFGKVGETIASEDSSLVGSGTNRQIQLSLKVIF